MDVDLALITRMIDEFLVEMGTQSLVDGDKVRDLLLDFRSVVMSFTPEIVEDVKTVSTFGGTEWPIN